MPVTHLDNDPCTTVTLPHRLDSAPEARTRMRGELAQYGLGREVVGDAEIVISELVANACEHGAPNEVGHIEVSWCLHDNHLRLSVLDGGRVDHLEAVPFDPASLRGRGLSIVDYLCDNWVVDRDHGTRVTAEMRFEPLTVNA